MERLTCLFFSINYIRGVVLNFLQGNLMIVLKINKHFHIERFYKGQLRKYNTQKRIRNKF